jgi:prolyl-tRNA synthetase
VIAPWCGDAACEAQIKAETQATIRNMPMPRGHRGPCVRCGKTAIAEAGSPRRTDGATGASG